MQPFENISKRVPFGDRLPTLESIKQRPLPARLAFIKRRVRIKGSPITVPVGVILIFPLAILFATFFLLLRTPTSPGRILIPTSRPPPIRKISEKHDKPFGVGCYNINTDGPRANGAFVVLARNKELDGVIQSMKSIERHFNRWYNYPYVFLNDGDFNETFKEVVQTYTDAKVEFGKIDDSMWGFPDWVDKDEAKEGIAKQGDRAIMYGGMESYHHMCRFYSGQFYKHPLLDKYKWYWRLEPEIKYFCDITYDPFMHMELNNKTYGFTIAVKELKETVPNLFRYASAYMRANGLKSQGLWEMFTEEPKKPKKKPEPPADNNLPEEIRRMQARPEKLPEIDLEAMEDEKYNMCHFWSNFEIARLDFFRSKEYEEFFQIMDRSGGFWNERWGDAPIHSLAAGALLSVKDIHYFRDFGYRHTTIQHCPANAPARQLPRPKYIEKTTVAKEGERKAKQEDDYWEHYDEPRENGVGCRCRCDTDIVDVEGKEGSCLAEWVKVAGGWASP